MILEAPQMLTPELLGLPNHASPYLSKVRSRPGETNTQWTQRLQQPGFGASWDPSYALASSTHLPHSKTPQGSPWGFDIDLWAWKEMHPEERSYCGVSFISRSDVCRRCSISDFSKLDPPNTKSAREGSRAFVIVIVMMMRRRRKQRRMLIKITTIHQAHTHTM